MTVLEKTAGLLAFVKTVETGSFTNAARLAGSTPSAITKSVARLEARLQARLFKRSTRSLSLTKEGQEYYNRVAPLLRGIEEAEEVFQTAPAAHGTLFVTMPNVLGIDIVGEITSEFLTAHDAIRLKVSVSDYPCDILAEGIDIAFRIGNLGDSELICRRLADLRLLTVASPSYLDKYGLPTSLKDVPSHRWIRYLLNGKPYPVRLGPERLDAPSSISIDNGCALREAVIRGGGIGQLIDKTIEKDLEEGRLVRLFPEIACPVIPFHAMHGYKQQTPVRARLLIDFVRRYFK